MLLTKGMKLLIADDARALMFAVEGREELRLLDKRNAEPGAEYSDQPGLVGDGATGHGTAFEKGNPERLARARFAQEVADMSGALLGDARLIVAAPPPMLAALRAALPKPVVAQIIAEVDKTLTGHPVPDLVKVLAAALDPV